MQSCREEGDVRVPIYKLLITFCTSTLEQGVLSSSPEADTGAHEHRYLPSKPWHLSEASRLGAYLMLPSCLIGEYKHLWKVIQHTWDLADSLQVPSAGSFGCAEDGE